MSYNMEIYNALKKYSEVGFIPFHMPGHKMGRLIPEILKKDMLRFDLTELQGLDNLHFPEGLILRAQKRTSRAVGSRESFFLVNGSTAGILASVYSTVGEGDKIIVGRDCHRSLINSLSICGAIPIFVKPYFLESYGISGTLCVEDLALAMEENPDAKAVFITRPTYYGLCCDIKKIREITQDRGMILIVDEAHGAHFPYSEKGPISAIEAGADLVIQSAHKTLPAPNQTGYLHVNGEKIDLEKLKFTLSMFQTTSPSYIFLMLLDFACEYMDNEGRIALTNLHGIASDFRKKFYSHERVKILNNEDLPEGLIDPTRLTINVSNAGMSGFEFDRLLEEKFKVLVEMSDSQNIVCISTVSDTQIEINILEEGIWSICKNSTNNNSYKKIKVKDLPIPKLTMSPKNAYSRAYEKILLKDAEGRIAKHTITPYPPGVASICPGENFSEEIIESLTTLHMQGAKIDGIDENMLVNVVCLAY